jgi:hypothetical protein
MPNDRKEKIFLFPPIGKEIYIILTFLVKAGESNSGRLSLDKSAPGHVIALGIRVYLRNPPRSTQISHRLRSSSFLPPAVFPARQTPPLT